MSKIATIYGCLMSNNTPDTFGQTTFEPSTPWEQIVRIADEKRKEQDSLHTLLRIRELAEKLEGELKYYKTLSGVDTDSIVKTVVGIRIVAIDEIDRLSRKEQR